MHKINFLILYLTFIFTIQEIIAPSIVRTQSNNISEKSLSVESMDSLENFKLKIKERCAVFGCKKEIVQFIMMCESRGNPKALNNVGPYKGLFQFTDAIL